MVREFLSLIQGLSIHGGGGRGVQGFRYDWVFPLVTLNGDIMVWFVVSQENYITALKLFITCCFNNFKGVGFLIDVLNLENNLKK